MTKWLTNFFFLLIKLLLKKKVVVFVTMVFWIFLNYTPLSVRCEKKKIKYRNTLILYIDMTYQTKPWNVIYTRNDLIRESETWEDVLIWLLFPWSIMVINDTDGFSLLSGTLKGSQTMGSSFHAFLGRVNTISNHWSSVLCFPCKKHTLLQKAKWIINLH